MESLKIKQEDVILIDDDYITEKAEEKTEETIETGDLSFLAAAAEEEDEDEEDCFSKPFNQNLTAAKPMEGLSEAGPTPFVRKTYEMVEDPSTDGIISWSGSKKSFVVWDYHHFSTLLLPKHFKHNNFSSFIRQLNTYGFKKIDPDRWEFANEGFQKGQKHKLKYIKRRKQIHQANSGVESEIEKLNNESSKLKLEISKLKHQQESTQGHLAAFKEKLERNEDKQQQMFAFMAKTLSNPGFLLKFIKILRHERANCDTQIMKKQKLIAPKSNADKEKKQRHEEFATIESEMNFSPNLDVEDSSGREGQKDSCTSSSPDLGCGNYISWEKLWADEFVCENKGDGEFGENNDNSEDELGDLITKPSEHWNNYTREMVVQAADVA